MKTEISSDQKALMVKRAVRADNLEDALVKSLLKNTTYKQEIRRLNQNVARVNALKAQVREQEREITGLVALLERDDEENEKADTDPAPSLEEVEQKHADEAYKNWDMRTRYPNLAPRKAG